MVVPDIVSSTQLLQEDFEDFFENSLCGFVTADAQGKILRGNSRLAGWLGYTPEELNKKHFSDLLVIGGKIYYETHLAPLLRMQGFFDEVALEMTCKDGNRLQVLVNASERRDQQGKPQFIRYIVYKATDRRLYEQNLRNAKTEAEISLSNERATSVLREQFLAILSHDLRNPVGAIISGTQLMDRSTLSERNSRLIDMMGASAARMSELIENVMDFARVRMGGGMAMNMQSVHLEPILTHVVEELRSAYPARIIETVFTLPIEMVCDAARISQILSNLLANALTHGSPDYPIKITASIENNLFELSVSNSGKQIPSASLERLFQPFTREDAHASQNGLGLGLYISSEIARAHNGKLSATSTAQETCFIFHMPVSG